MYETKTYTAISGAAGTFTSPAAPPQQPTRFSNYAGVLEARVSSVASLIDRLSRVADRLGGPVPEEAQTANKIRGNGNCIASQIENSLDDLEGILRRAERTAERLEQL